MLVLVVFAVFINSVFNGYALDDEFYTNGSNALTNKGVSAIPEIFKSRTFFNSDGSGYEYRPMTLTAFAIEHSIFGQKPHVSHFINLLLYALTIVLLFRLLKKWLHGYSDWVVFFISLLFAVHPLHTEVVDNIKCRDELLSLLFCIIGMQMAWRHYETGKWFYLVFYPLAFLAGMLCKFSILPYLVLIPLAMWYFTDMKFSRAAMYLVPLILALVVLYLIMSGLPAAKRELLLHENPFRATNAGIPERSATGFYVLAQYVLIHIFPHPLSYYYGFEYIPLVDWSNVVSIVSLVFHAALGFYCIKTLRKKSLLTFGIIFYLANIAMFSNIVRATPGLMAERFAYSAALGFCIVVIVLLFRAGKLDLSAYKWSTGRWPRTVILLLVFAFGLRSIARNEDWENKMTLYGNDMEHLDNSAKANLLFGSLVSSSALAHKHYDSLTIVKYHFRRAVEIYPDYATAWSNLGSTFFFMREYDSSKYFFRKSITLNPKYKEGLFNMGMAHLNTNLRDSAVFYFDAAIEADSTYMAPYEQLAKLEALKGRFTSCLHILRRAAENNPKSDQPYMTAASLIQNTSRNKDLAAGFYEVAAMVNPGNIDRLSNLSSFYFNKGNSAKGQYYDSMYKAQVKILERMGRGPKRNK